MKHGCAEHPTPNYRHITLYPRTDFDDLDGMWGLERQVAGIEPGELALHDTRLPDKWTDPVFAVLAIIFIGLVAMDCLETWTFLAAVLR